MMPVTHASARVKCHSLTHTDGGSARRAPALTGRPGSVVRGGRAAAPGPASPGAGDSDCHGAETVPVTSAGLGLSGQETRSLIAEYRTQCRRGGGGHGARAGLGT
jgi:hypothetical protein